MISENMLVKHRKAGTLPEYPWLRSGRVVWAQTWGDGIGIADVLWDDIARQTIHCKVDGSSRSYSIPRYSLRRYPFSLLEVISDASPARQQETEVVNSYIKTVPSHAQTLRAQGGTTNGTTERTEHDHADLLESEGHSAPYCEQGDLGLKVEVTQAPQKPPRRRKAHS